MENLTKIFEECKREGVHEYGVIPIEKIEFSEEVRTLCKENQCGQYGKTWACPPGVGPLEECKAKCMKYKSAFIFTTTSKLEDSFDYEGMIEGKRVHELVSEKVRRLFEEEFTELLVLSSEGCQNCEDCTYPDAPCRFPHRMSPSVESYGIMVNQEAKEAGIHYINGANSVTYFSNIFF